MGEAGDSRDSAYWQAGGPPGSCWLEQLRQAWERPSLQLCPQGRAQHSSRLPAEALAEPVPGWQCRVAKQWPSALASARAMGGRGGKMGQTQSSSLDQLPSPGSPLPPRNHRSGLTSGTYPGCSGCPPSLGSKPSPSGSMQRAGFLGAWVHQASRREETLVLSPASPPGMAWDGHSIWPPPL